MASLHIHLHCYLLGYVLTPAYALMQVVSPKAAAARHLGQ